MSRCLLLLLIGLSIRVAAADATPTAGLSACRAIADDAERLACYDRLSELVSPLPTASTPIPAAAAVAATPTIRRDEAFGAEAVRKPKSEEQTILSASVVGRVDGVRRDQVFRLDNGQRWRVLDDREFDYVAEQPSARIERNVIGTYWMKLGDQGPRFKVRRLQ